jgi:gluconolactonase
MPFRLLLVALFCWQSLSVSQVVLADEPPAGEVTQYVFEDSKVFPGTVRPYWVYVPQQYDGKTPACVYVCQDGIQYNAPKVFDRLIHEKKMPVTIGVFVMHGRVLAPSSDSLDRFNRSFEYDGLGDGYARFLLNELLPDVEKQTTTNGRAIVLSKSGNDRCIAGSSSGAICAFTAAWEKPQEFSRVFSAVGTYVGLRGGHSYSTLVRKYEPKPIRVFLEDGSTDLNIYGGDWWIANQAMERSLVFAGYEVAHRWGDGGHNANHATEIFPEAMEYLWKDWPKPVKGGLGSPQLQEILVPGEDWKLVGEGYGFTEGAASDKEGRFYFNQVGASKTYRVGEDGKPVLFLENTKNGDGQCLAPDGRLVQVAAGAEALWAYDLGQPKPTATPIATGFHGNDMAIRHDGTMYVTHPGWNGSDPSRIWMVKPNGEKVVVDEGLKFSNGICLSPDQSLLYVADTKSHWVYSYQIQEDGKLAHKQRYYHLHLPDDADDAGTDGLEVDADGRLYVATRLGLQVCDQAGRVNCIIPVPAGQISNIAFGGTEFRTILITAGDKVYTRKVKPQGCPTWKGPIKPAAPRL